MPGIPNSQPNTTPGISNWISRQVHRKTRSKEPSHSKSYSPHRPTIGIDWNHHRPTTGIPAIPDSPIRRRRLSRLRPSRCRRWFRHPPTLCKSTMEPPEVEFATYCVSKVVIRFNLYFAKASPADFPMPAAKKTTRSVRTRNPGRLEKLQPCTALCQRMDAEKAATQAAAPALQPQECRAEFSFDSKAEDVASGIFGNSRITKMRRRKAWFARNHAISSRVRITRTDDQHSGMKLSADRREHRAKTAAC